MPITSGMAAAGTFNSRAQATAALIAPMVRGAMPGARAVVRRVGAGQPRADLEADDEGRQRLRRRRAGLLGERQQRRDHRRHELALRVGEIEIERVRGDAIGQRRKLRRGLQRRADHRHRGRRALRPHHVAHDLRDLFGRARERHADAYRRRPSARARWRAAAPGFRSKPATNSAIRADSFGNSSAPGLRLCRAGKPANTAAEPARNSRRSSQFLRCCMRMGPPPGCKTSTLTPPRTGLH